MVNLETRVKKVVQLKKAVTRAQKKLDSVRTQYSEAQTELSDELEKQGLDSNFS